MRSIYQTILEEIRAGTKNVLATVIETAGSTPQKPGSSALFSEAGLLAGTVGGGPLEAEVQHIAESVMISGFSDYFYFDLNDEPDSEGAICGGEARVLVDADPAANLAALEAMEDCLSRHEDGFLLTVVSNKLDQGRSIKRYWINGSKREDFPKAMDRVFKDLILNDILKAEQEGFIRIDLSAIPDHQVKMAFLEHMKPMPHLLIVGGGHVGKALAHLGSLLEFEISVLDDRAEFANKEHIPDADHVIVSEVGAALQKMKPGPESHIVIVTRGHRLDADALKACIGSEAAYIGMIGSRNKVALMKKQFLEEGWATPEQWAAIHAPIGLSIGSVTVQEIAVSIAAQLIEVRNKRHTRHG